MKPEDWGQVVNTNLNSFYNVTRPVVKQMALNRWGRIVSIASTAGQTGVEGQVNGYYLHVGSERFLRHGSVLPRTTHIRSQGL